MQCMIGSNNRGKVAEIRAILSGLAVDLVTPEELGLSLSIEESANSYAGNAARKAQAYALESGLLTLSDDSGLEVDALDGKPGLHSARFSPKPGATDADRRALLLSHLDGKPRPWTARFRCVAALAVPLDATDVIEGMHFSEGIVEGEIIPEERGENGFGYDPIFLIPKMGRTMAELEMAEKNRISHRARAFLGLRPLLEEIIANGVD